MALLMSKQTLRPLVRRVFNLDDSMNRPSGRVDWPAAERRARREYDEYELGPSKDHGLTTVKARRFSDIPDSASEEHILQDVGGIQGIQIQRTVLQNVRYKSDGDDDL